MELVELTLIHLGMSCNHNLKCWLCNKNPAVYNMHPNWCFEPCWTCQDSIGGKIYRVKNKIIQWFINP